MLRLFRAALTTWQQDHELEHGDSSTNSTVQLCHFPVFPLDVLNSLQLCGKEDTL